MLGLVMAWALPSAALAEEIPPEIQATFDQFRATVAKLDDASLLFSRKEWLNGSYRPYQELAMSFRSNGDIYIRFAGKDSHGREVLWKPSVDPDVLLVKPSPIIPALKIAPDGALAKKDSRHHVGMATFHALADRILGEMDKLRDDPNLDGKFTDHGKKMAQNRNAHCFQVDLPRDKDPTLYSDRIELCFDLATHLPVTLRAWEKDGDEYRQVEDYSWTQVQLNPGFGDEVFDPDNPTYNF
jgi:hypothetical protein